MSVDIEKLNKSLEILSKNAGVVSVSNLLKIENSEDLTEALNIPVTLETKFNNIKNKFSGLDMFLEGLDINSITSGMQAITKSGAFSKIKFDSFDLNILKDGISIPSEVQNIAKLLPQIAQPMITKITSGISVADNMIPKMDAATITKMTNILQTTVENGFPSSVISLGTPGAIAETLASVVPNVNSNQIKSVIENLTHIETVLPELKSYLSTNIKSEVFTDMFKELDNINKIFENLLPSITGNPLIDMTIKNDSKYQEIFKTLGITDIKTPNEILKLLYAGNNAGAINRIEKELGNLTESQEAAILAKLEDIKG